MARRRSNEDLLEESLGLKSTLMSQLRLGERILAMVGAYTTVNFFSHIPPGVTIFVAILFAVITKFIEGHSLD